MNATLTDQYPGATPPGTEVEVLTLTQHWATIKVGRKVVKVAPAWLAMETEPDQFTARGLRLNRVGVLG